MLFEGPILLHRPLTERSNSPLECAAPFCNNRQQYYVPPNVILTFRHVQIPLWKPFFSQRRAVKVKTDTLLRPTAPWIWLALLAAVVAMLGGSSRPDVVQIAVLRPLVALFLIPALYYLDAGQLRKAGVLVALLGLLAVWMALQLVPLPPSLWQSLPGREIVANLDRLAGIEGSWRPISLAPDRGWNALASLVVPATGLLLALAMRVSPRMLLFLIAGLGLCDAALGILQVISGRSSPLYFYSITTQGAPVGIFANENHSAVFSAIVLLVIARLGVTSKSFKEPAWLRLAYAPSFVVVLLAVLVGGSRAGIATATFALLATGLMIWQTPNRSSRRHRRQSKLQQWLARHPRVLPLIFLVAIAGLLAAFFGLERAPGFENIFSQSVFEDLRAGLWPILQQMIATFWMMGIGFGSFEAVYHIYEPTALLLPSYVNQAHNDWAQLVIEGGLPTLAMLGSLLIWILLSLRGQFARQANPLPNLVFWVAVFSILMAASVVDYPLRAPVFQLAIIWLLLVLSLENSTEFKV